MATVLTTEQLAYLAQSAQWKFDVSFKNERGADDAVVFTGDGVDDLTQLITRLEGMTVSNGFSRVKVLCDTGKLFSNWVIVTVSDVYALREKYIDIWGTVSKPGYPYNVPFSQATKEFPSTPRSGVAPGVAYPISPDTIPGLATPNPPGIGNTGDWQDYGDGRANRLPPHSPAPI
jgi:hypothetical protein